MWRRQTEDLEAVMTRQDDCNNVKEQYFHSSSKPIFLNLGNLGMYLTKNGKA